MGVHKSSADDVGLDGSITTTIYSTNLTKSKDFILEAVNGWHYPTYAEGKNITVTVQSLHMNITSDQAYTDSNVTITGGSCVGKSTINAFEKCTYELEADGAGKLYLSPDEYVEINKPEPETETEPSTGGGSGGGGSFGFLSLFGLAILGWKRRK